MITNRKIYKGGGLLKIMEKEGYTIDPQLKNQINSEGWEDDYALLIGKKENGELSNLLERLEANGRAKDLANYIRLNKKIIVPNKEVSKNISNYTRGYFLRFWDLFYVDKDKNICTVEINASKIDSLVGKREHYYASEYTPILHNELAELGFERIEENKISGIESVLETYKNKSEDVKKEKIKQDFNF